MLTINVRHDLFGELAKSFTPKGFDPTAQGKRSATLGKVVTNQCLPRRGYIIGIQPLRGKCPCQPMPTQGGASLTLGYWMKPLRGKMHLCAFPQNTGGISPENWIMRMLELTPENAEAFLRARSWIGPGPVQIEALSWGVSNAVLRVTNSAGPMIVKQSRPQLRTKAAWFSDLNRVFRELEVMQMLAQVLPEGTVPKVLHVDRDNYAFAMSHAPLEARVWKADLLAGQVDQSVGERAGMILGRMHEVTARNHDLVKPFADSTVFVQLRIDPFYRSIQKRWPDLANVIEPIIAGLLTTQQALCHGDYSPKNILVHAQGFTLVDYETAYFGDPAMDLGFFLSHLLLKAMHRPQQRSDYFDLTRSFWAGYDQEVTFAPILELQKRTIGHLAVCALARIDGTSPVDYLDQEVQREAVRRWCRWVLENTVITWEALLDQLETELARFG
jgi:5-methylthioribose kinase